MFYSHKLYISLYSVYFSIEFIGRLFGIRSGMFIALLIICLIGWIILLTSIKSTIYIYDYIIENRIIILFLSWCAIALIWSSSPNYGSMKLLKITVKLMFAIPIMILIIRNKKHFLNSLLYVSIIVIVGFFISYGNPIYLVKYLNPYDRLGQTEISGPIIVGRYWGMIATLVVITSVQVKKTKHSFVAFWWFVFIISSSYMLLTGSKGPLVSTFIGISLFAFIAVRKSKSGNNILKVLTGTVIIFAVYYAFLPQINYFFESQFYYNRLLENTSSYESRINIAANALQHLISSELPYIILGKGLGSYSSFYMGEDIMSYPHNILLEVVFELGIIGLVLMFVVLIDLIRHIFFKNINSIDIAYFILAVYFFVNAMFTGDLSHNINSIIFYVIGKSTMLKKENKVS